MAHVGRRALHGPRPTSPGLKEIVSPRPGQSRWRLKAYEAIGHLSKGVWRRVQKERPPVLNQEETPLALSEES